MGTPIPTANTSKVYRPTRKARPKRAPRTWPPTSSSMPARLRPRKQASPTLRQTLPRARRPPPRVELARGAQVARAAKRTRRNLKMSEMLMRAGLAAEVTTLLRYELTTDPFPLEASPTTGSPELATLKVVGSNPDPSNPVTIRSVSITLPVGSDAAHLTNQTPDGPVPPDGWTVGEPKVGQGVVQYVFKPDAGKGRLPARDSPSSSTTFRIFDLTVKAHVDNE